MCEIAFCFINDLGSQIIIFLVTVASVVINTAIVLCICITETLQSLGRGPEHQLKVIAAY